MHLEPQEDPYDILSLSAEDLDRKLSSPQGKHLMNDVSSVLNPSTGSDMLAESFAIHACPAQHFRETSTSPCRMELQQEQRACPERHDAELLEPSAHWPRESMTQRCSRVEGVPEWPREYALSCMTRNFFLVWAAVVQRALAPARPEPEPYVTMRLERNTVEDRWRRTTLHSLLSVEAQYHELIARSGVTSRNEDGGFALFSEVLGQMLSLEASHPRREPSLLERLVTWSPPPGPPPFT